MKKTKKGFTIVELIIVIAVIAVLTAILVPTFIHLTNKANEAADKSLVTNLNKALAMREAEEGEKGKNNTMYDCVMDLEKEGYKLPQLATRSGQDLVWSQKANRFFLGNDYVEKDHGGKFNCWHIYEKMPTEQTWAIYPNEDKWTEKTVSVSNIGFDAGKAKVSSVTYNGNAGYKITLRTNGGELVINASTDTVNHYNYVDTLMVNAVAPTDCYHEFGQVGTATILSGKFIAEPEAFVAQISVKGEAKLEASDPEQVGYVAATNANNVTGCEVDKITQTINYTDIGNGKKTYVEGELVKTALFVSTADELKNALNGTTSLEGIAKVCLANDIKGITVQSIDKNIEGYFVVSTNVVLDLNGYTIEATLKQSDKALIVVNTTKSLTILDTVGNGRVLEYAAFTTDFNGYVIKNHGNLVLDAGTLEMAYADGFSGRSAAIATVIDNYNNWTSNDVTFTMNAGSIVGAEDIEGMRIDQNTPTSVANPGLVTVTINNGYINGWDAFFMQFGTTNLHGDMTLTINDGAFIGTKAPIRVYESNCASATLAQTIHGNINLNGGMYLTTDESLRPSLFDLGYNNTIGLAGVATNSKGWEPLNITDKR